jgi:hypothetical protein
MRLSNELPPNIPTEAETPSRLQNSALKTATRESHELVIAIFFVFGALALVPTIYFTNRQLAEGEAALKQGRYATVTLYDRALASPSTFFPLTMVLAGVAAWKLGLVPRGIRISFLRVLGGAVLGFFLYPVGMLSILFVVLLGMSWGGGENWPNVNSPIWARLLGNLPLAAILCAGGMLTILLAAVALALVTRSWPRRVLLWSFVTSSGVLICSVSVSLAIRKLLFPAIPLLSHLINSGTDLLAFSMIWGVEAPIVVGEPILAALLGHWFFLAAKEWSAKRAQ